MIRIVLLMILGIAALTQLSAQDRIGWGTLADVRFAKEKDPIFGLEHLRPTFGEQVSVYDGKEVLLSGYFIPATTGHTFFVLSRNPFSACYFCGGAGPESVVEIWPLAKDFKAYKTDQRLTFKGRLRLNAADPNHLTYILELAEDVTE